MSEAVVHYELSDAIATITLDRPEAANALNETARLGLREAFERFAGDDHAAVAILTATGERAFCAGADLKEMADTAMAVPPPDYIPYLGRRIQTDKPVIAAVNGVAYAGGFLLAQMCDLVVAAEHARFAITEARWSRGAPWAGPLPWLIPPRVAMELLLTAEPIDARRALHVGLVNRVVPVDQLQAEARVLAATIAANAPLSVRASKRLVYATLGLGLEAALAEGDRIFEPVYLSEDAQEGPQAFREKRPPQWKGR